MNQIKNALLGIPDPGNLRQEYVEPSIDDNVIDDIEYETLARHSEQLVMSSEAYHDALRSSENMIERMENIRSVIELDPIPSDASRVLIDEGMRAVLGSSETSVESLLPTLHQEGSVVSTESIRSSISNALSRIIDYIRRAMESMAELWGSLMSMSKWVRFTATNGLNRVKTSKGLTASKSSFTFRGDVNRIMINGAVYKSNAILQSNLVEIRRQLEYFTTNHAVLLGKIGDDLKNAISNIKEPDKSLSACIDAANLMNHSTVAGYIRARNQSDVRFDGGQVDAAPGLLGNRTIYVPKEIVPNAAASILSRAQDARRRSISLLHTNEEQAKLGESVNLPIMSTTEAEGILTEVVKIANLVDSYDSNKRRSLTKKIRDITDAYKKRCEVADKLELTNDGRAQHNSIGRFVTQYSTMVSTPTDSLIVHALAVCRIVIAITNRSMQYYR